MSDESQSHSPFSAHALRVAAKFPGHTSAHTVALYHDHIEDGLGDVPEEVMHEVLLLTRRPGEPYFDYIRGIRASGNGIARVVKMADLEDNRARCRGEFGGRVDEELDRRYERAQEILNGR